MHNNVEDIRNDVVFNFVHENFVEDKSGCKVIEIINASFEANENSIFGKPNEDYIKRELEWYKSQSLNVNDIPGNTPQIWKDVSSNYDLINSNYGHLIWSADNMCQYENVRMELGENPASRRATMIYTRPTIWLDAFKDGMSDFICTNNVQYFVRDNKLVTCVYMRSNDIVYGYNNDFAWQQHVRDKLLEDLETDCMIAYEPGPIYWNVGSLHIYERHFNLIQEYIDKSEADYEELILLARAEAEKARNEQVGH
jgi:thymidylate synthase